MASSTPEALFPEPPPDLDPCLLCRAIMHSFTDGVVAITPDHRISAFNPAAATITGIPREKAIGQGYHEVLNLTSGADRCVVCEAMETGNVVTNRRVTFARADGREIPLSVSVAPLRDPDGCIVGAVESFRDLTGLEQLRKELTRSYSYQDIVGRSAQMGRLFKILPAVAESDSTVLLEGDSGTGKELFARAIHDLSRRQEKPYVIVNCGALPETLLESELFGYQKGAFTDARRDKPGRFELAEGGSLLLDEVEALSPAVQVKLLRVIEKRVFERLGGTRSIQADVRIIAATNRPLRALVSAGEFREDLFYRLNVVTLEIPPLRDRRDDIALLVSHFVGHFNALKGKDIVGVTPAVMRRLMEYDFPGNVRELQNVIEHAFVLCEGGLIDLDHLPRMVASAGPGPPAVGSVVEGNPPVAARPLDVAEADAIRSALARNSSRRADTARDLGISTATLWRKMKRHGITG